MSNAIALAKELLKRHEGEKLKPYRCTAGHLTIGIGHNLDAKGISKRVCDIMFAEDIVEVAEWLEKQDWYNDLDTIRQAAIIDMTFQLGIKGMSDFKNTIAAFKNMEYQAAAEHMTKSKWFAQTPGRAEEIINIIRTGNFIQIP